LIDPPGRAIGRPAGTTTRAETAALAAEREQMFGVAGVAPQAQKTVLQPAALQVAIDRLPHVARQLFTGLGQVFDKGRVVALDELAEQRLLGAMALVAASGQDCW